jgi:hypothetical protein
MREVWTSRERTYVRQMLFDFVPCLALHFGILCDLGDRSSEQASNSKPGLVRTPTDLGHPQTVGRLLFLLTTFF